MRVISVHSPHERCGIAEYGRQLDDALRAAGSDVTAMTFAAFQEAEVSLTITPDVVLVHFEPSLVPPGFLNALASAKTHGAKIVLCCHWYAPTAFSTAALRTVDRFIVHRKYDGLKHPKFVEIPLGCPVYEPKVSRAELRQQFGLPQNDLVITTLGFLSPWKRIPEVLGDLLFGSRLCNNHGRPMYSSATFQVLTPLPFNDTSDAQAQAVYEVLAKYPNAPVIFSTTFRPEQELLDRVYASDLGFLFHGQHTGSVSAATKQFVSARCPVVVTGSSHAADLNDGVVRLDEFNTVKFAHGVLTAASNADYLAQLRHGIAFEYERLNMNAVAHRYIDLFNSLGGQS
jgi:hypothetical protein